MTRPYRYKLSEAARRERSAAASKRMKRLRADPKFIAKLQAALTDPEFVTKSAAANREFMKQKNADPNFAAKRDAVARKTITRLNTDPEFVAKRDAVASKTMKQRHVDPEFAAKLAEARRNRRANMSEIRKAAPARRV